MPLKSRTTLKSYFETNDTPTQSNYEDLIDSIPNFVDDSPTFGFNWLGDWDDTLRYVKYDSVYYSVTGASYVCIKAHDAYFVPTNTTYWSKISEKGADGDAATQTQLADVKTPPTDLKISTASKGGVLRNIDGAVGDVAQTATGWIEDEKYGIYVFRVATAISAEFDSAVTRNGRLTLKLSNTDLSGCSQAILNYPAAMGGTQQQTMMSKYGIRIKPSTTYTIKCWAKTNNVAANAVSVVAREYTEAGTFVIGAEKTSTALTGTNDWTELTITFTTNASAYYMRIGFNNSVAGNISDAWFDVNSMTLEEVVTDTTFTGKVAEKIRPVLQAITSTDSIDQSLDPTGAYTNTYALTTAVNEGATHLQTFTPTKKYTTQIGVWCVAKGTGNWTLVVHNAANDILASRTIGNAFLVEGAFNYFDVPNIWASGDLHFHLYSSVADGTCKANTSNDLETASYIQRYAKKSENFTLVANGIKTQLKADKDGLLSNAIIDLDNGKYRYLFEPSVTNFNNLNDIYSLTLGDNPDVLVFGNCWSLISSVPSFIRSGSSTGIDKYVVWKVNTILPIKKLILGTRVASGLTRAIRFEYSFDGSNWATLQALTADLTSSEYVPTDLFNKRNSFYIRILKPDSNQHLSIYNFSIEADLDTSSIPQGLFYPIGTNQFTETWKSPSTVLSYVYRQNKYVNEYGVLMPAIELNSGATGDGLALGYYPLKIDNSQETAPAITILASSGVASDTILDADGEYVALSSGATEGVINYQVTITKNTLYLSSNGESVDSTQDPSHQANFIVGVRQQGLLDSVKDVRDETELIRKGLKDTKELIRNSAMTLGFDTGTTDDYAITLQDFTGYQTGLSVIFRANTANTGASTLNINGMGAKAIVKGVSTALANNDILALMWCQCVYDGTNFVLLNPRAL